MSDEVLSKSGEEKRRPARRRGIKDMFRRARRRFERRLLRSRFVNQSVSALIYGSLRFIGSTQSAVDGSTDPHEVLVREHPAIVALWHGQHLLAPFFKPTETPVVALLSRSADAELNASVVKRFGFDTIRGSGGRAGRTSSKKGGARAVIALKRRLAEGWSVGMIADVPKGTPREAGLGIVTLARISGRPVLPSAAVTSRRYVVKSSWDKTTIPLPFGRMATVIGEPIYVPANADAQVMELKRVEITRAIEAANQAAERLLSEVA